MASVLFQPGRQSAFQSSRGCPFWTCRSGRRGCGGWVGWPLRRGWAPSCSTAVVQFLCGGIALPLSPTPTTGFRDPWASGMGCRAHPTCSVTGWLRSGGGHHCVLQGVGPGRRPYGSRQSGEDHRVEARAKASSLEGTVLIYLLLWLACPGGHTEPRLAPAGHYPWISGFPLQIEQKALFLSPLKGSERSGRQSPHRP